MTKAKLIIFIMVVFFPAFLFAGDNLQLSEESQNLTFANPLPASFTVDQLLDRMERKSAGINAIVSEVELSDSLGTVTVTLRVKSPDKFSITFADGSSSVYFNGSKLWIYIKKLNECFYHYSEPSPFWCRYSSLLYYFEPKKLFVNVTRGTLNAIFDIVAVKREELDGNDYHYVLKLTPKLKEIFKRVFELGHYEAVFSEKLYLPVKIIEYDIEGRVKNQLRVNCYKMNTEVSDGLFQYKDTTGAVMVPISIVILQKLDDYKNKVLEEFDKAKEALTNRILNWSF